MDSVRNPYSPGAGAPPPALVGRGEEIEEFDVAVQRLGLGCPARSVLMTGLRGVGKTVLLREFGRIAAGHGWIHQSLEASEKLDFVASAATLARKALLRLSAGRRVADLVGTLGSFQLRWQPDSGGLTLGIDALSGRPDSGDLEEGLADLFGAGCP
ncbi:MAG: ATP-binding protein [bacterium]|nr:ATP-binding protein [bacterium]